MRTALQAQTIENDSIMELLSVASTNPEQTENLNKSLVIVPETHANIARFFNGINNSLKGSKQKL